MPLTIQENPPSENATEQLTEEEVADLPSVESGMDGVCDLATLARMAPPEVIPKMLYKGGKAILAAAAKLGKTVFVGNLLHAATTGGKFMGRTFPKLRVLQVDLELTDFGMAKRLAHLSDAIGEEISPDWCRLLLRQHPDFRSWPRVRHVIAKADETNGPFDLIVIDCLYRLQGGVDENDNGAMAAVGVEIDRITNATGAAVLVIHHTGKGGGAGRDVQDRLRGGSVLAGEFDLVASISAHEEPDHLIFEAICRDFAAPEPATLRFAYPLLHDSDMTPKARKPGAPPKVGDGAILQAVPVGRQNATGAAEIAKAVSLSVNGTKERLDRLNGVESEKEGAKWLFWR